MERYYYKKSQRGKDDYTSDKNKKGKFNYKYLNDRKYDNYNEPYSYKRSGYDYYDDEDYYVY